MVLSQNQGGEDLINDEDAIAMMDREERRAAREAARAAEAAAEATAEAARRGAAKGREAPPTGDRTDPVLYPFRRGKWPGAARSIGVP